MNKAANFWDKIAARYSKRPISDQTAYEKKLTKSQEYLSPESNVLEFGCGTSSTAIRHAPYVAHIRAIDISAKMLEIARSNAASANIENISFELAAIDELEVEDSTYDVILGLSILHLLDDRDVVIKKVYDMLKPGGVFISNSFCASGAINLLRPVMAIGNLIGLLPMVRFFSRKALDKSLNEVGFEIDYAFQPDKSKAAFIVAKKVAK